MRIGVPRGKGKGQAATTATLYRFGEELPINKIQALKRTLLPSI
jgi:hypothetical protein